MVVATRCAIRMTRSVYRTASFLLYGRASCGFDDRDSMVTQRWRWSSCESTYLRIATREEARQRRVREFQAIPLAWRWLRLVVMN